MLDIVTFFAAGSALGGASTWLHGRQPSALLDVCGLYAVAFAVCCLVAHATQVAIVAFIEPYALIAVTASLGSAGLLIRWPASPCMGWSLRSDTDAA